MIVLLFTKHNWTKVNVFLITFKRNVIIEWVPIFVLLCSAFLTSDYRLDEKHFSFRPGKELFYLIKYVDIYKLYL